MKLNLYNNRRSILYEISLEYWDYNIQCNNNTLKGYPKAYRILLTFEDCTKACFESKTQNNLIINEDELSKELETLSPLNIDDITLKNIPKFIYDNSLFRLCYINYGIDIDEKDFKAI